MEPSVFNTLSSVADLIAKLGFPIFVAGYLLIRIEPVLKNINEILVKLVSLIEHKF